MLTFNNTRQASAMTLVEVMIASSIALMVISGLLVLILVVAKEQQKAVAYATLLQRSSKLQDDLMRLLRNMSESESAIFGDRVVESGVPVYQKIIVAQGKAPDYPREEVAFRATENEVVHDPNRSLANDEVNLYVSKPAAALRKLFFYPSLKPGNIPDHSTLNVWMEMDDGGASGRRNPEGTFKTNTIVRTFTVKMRNF